MHNRHPREACLQQPGNYLLRSGFLPAVESLGERPAHPMRPRRGDFGSFAAHRESRDQIALWLGFSRRRALGVRVEWEIPTLETAELRVPGDIAAGAALR